MGKRDNAFQRLLADEHLFVRFIRRYLRQHMPDAIDVETLTPEDVYREEADIMLAYMQKELRKARREGREEGREEIVIRLLERGMAISLVSEITGFAEDRVRELSKRKL